MLGIRGFPAKATVLKETRMIGSEAELSCGVAVPPNLVKMLWWRSICDYAMVPYKICVLFLDLFLLKLGRGQ